MTASLRVVLSASLSTTALLVTNVCAQTFSIERNGSFLERVHCTGASYSAHELRAGHSSGAWQDDGDSSHDIRSADNRNLDFYFQRSSHSPEWSISLGSWSDQNGEVDDFFLFDVGGDDVVQATPQFADGTYGTRVLLSGWTPTGHVVTQGGLSGQEVHGLSFGRSDLLDANGLALDSTRMLSGLRLDSISIDGACFLVHTPDPAVGPDTFGSGALVLQGSLHAYQPLEVRFEGAWASATSNSPNPFLDTRLQLVFSGPGARRFEVPGFFAGDGQGGLEGFVWKGRFTPDVPGLWKLRVHHREGSDAALSSELEVGSAGMLDGLVRAFVVTPRDRAPAGQPAALAPERYVGLHYMRDADGRYFLKTGCNSPENFLAYRGFDEVADQGGIGILHRYAAHVLDWSPGDPEFQSSTHPTDSRGIIGAINYLSSAGVNSLFTMLMNLGGDGQDVYPFVGALKNSFDKTHYHVGRLEQWNTVFEHAARRGVALHLCLAETESYNEKWLDNGALGTERKLFLREMVARFAHNPAIKWNLCEETDYYDAQHLTDFAAYIQSQDAYGHPICFHNLTNELDRFQEVLGQPEFEASSQQYLPDFAGAQVEAMRTLSAASGHPWLVQMDENGPWDVGASPGNAVELRKTVLYDVLFSGGQIEWYLGWYGGYPGGDLTVEDFRTRDEMWKYSREARLFCEQHLPFWRMRPMDSLLSGESPELGGGEVFVDGSELFAIYLPSTSATGSLDLSGATGTFVQRWYDPRNAMRLGEKFDVVAGALLPLGPPPSAVGQDWVVLLERE